MNHGAPYWSPWVAGVALGLVVAATYGSVTLADLLGVPFWVLAAALVAISVLLAGVLGRVETGRGKE